MSRSPGKPLSERAARRAAVLWGALVSLLAACAVALIFGKSLADLNGYLTQDSASYLELAERLQQGHGFTVSNSGLGNAGDQHFATWPVGYPALIAAISAGLGVTTFTASKLLNAGCLLLGMFAVARAFGAVGPALALVFLFAGTLETFTFSWSEAPFTALLALFAISLSRFMGNAPPGIWGLLTLTGLAILLFMTRYIGLFALAPIAVVAAWQAQRGDLTTALRLSLSAAATAAMAFGYLSYNKLATGFSTGVPRPAAEESAPELLSALAVAVFRELVLPIPYWVASDFRHNAILAIVVLALSFVTLKTARSPVEKPGAGTRALCLSFLLVGLCYLGAIIAARFSSHFDPFGFRLLSPGMTLLFIGLFALLIGHRPAARPAICGMLGLMAALSLAVHAVMLTSNHAPGGYKAGLEARARAYAALPEGAIVLYGIRHLRYQRPDVHIFHPGWHAPLSIAEDFNTMMAALDGRRPVYVEMGRWALNSAEQPAALRAFIATCDPSFYLSEIRLEAGRWVCIPVVRKS